MMARSSLARVVFFGIKPYQYSQIIHSPLRRPLPPVRDVPRWLPIGISSYSTKPTTEALRSQRNVSSTTNVQSSPADTPISETSSYPLNPPPSARPPPYNVPVRPPTINFAYVYGFGKAALIFYKSGIKAIYTNYKLTRTIRSRLSGDASRMPRTEQLKQGMISRGEYHLLQRTVEDLARVPLFALIFLIFSEWTPLVVIAVSGAVPRTLWIPKQVRKAREKLQERRKEAKATRQGMPPGDTNSAAEPQLAERDIVLRIGRMLGLYPTWWDRLPWMPVGTVVNRVQRRLEELEVDDMAIERDGAVSELEEQEVSMAAERRGLDVLDKDVEELRDHLESWLQARKHHTAMELIVNGLPPSEKS